MVYAKYKYHNRALAPTAKMWASHANFLEFNGSKKKLKFNQMNTKIYRLIHILAGHILAPNKSGPKRQLDVGHIYLYIRRIFHKNKILPTLTLLTFLCDIKL